MIISKVSKIRLRGSIVLLNTTATSSFRDMKTILGSMGIRHLGFAFIWACSMLTHRSSMLHSGSANTNDYQMIVVLSSFAANIAALFFFSSRIEQDPDYFSKLKSGWFVASIICGFMLLTGAGSFVEWGLVPHDLVGGILIVGASLSGFGYGYFWGSWAEYFGRVHPSRLVVYLPLALFVTATLFVLLSFAGEHSGMLAVLLMIPLPILSKVFLSRCLREEPQPEQVRHATTEKYRAALGSLVMLIVSGIVLSFLFGLLWQMTVLAVGSSEEAHQFPLIVNIIAAVAFFVFVIFVYRRIDLSFAFRVLIPIVIILFALMPLFWDANPVLINAIMSASYGIFDVIMWYMMASAAYDFAVSGFVVGSVVRALLLVARLVGIGVGYVVMLVHDASSILILGISVAAIYILTMIAVSQSNKHRSLFFGSASRATLRALSQEEIDTLLRPCAAKEGHFECLQQSEKSVFQEKTTGEFGKLDDVVFDRISSEYGLTKREREVLPYLAKGRSAKVIADILFVSESTIRTHTRRILEKTALHSKQELIDLIDATSSQ